MKFKSGYLLFIIIVLIFTGCNKDNKNISKITECDTSNTTFNQLYNTLVNTAPNQNRITMDLETHSYTFEVLTEQKICKIGYQSLSTFNTTPYLFEISDNTSSTLLYSGSHTFSSLTTSYVSIPPVQLIVGHSYTIKRIQKNWNGNIVNTIGRLVEGNLIFPSTFGALKITGSSFYGTGGPLDNEIIPYIDIVF